MYSAWLASVYLTFSANTKWLHVVYSVLKKNSLVRHSTLIKTKDLFKFGAWARCVPAAVNLKYKNYIRQLEQYFSMTQA